MSRFSGKCDLYDSIMMIGCKGTNDEMTEIEKFQIFKERTNGVIYQSKKLYLTKYNIDYEIEYINNPQILRKEKINGRTKYFYYGKSFSSLKALNNKGYYTKHKIIINELIDLVPYYPHLISIHFSDENSEYIEIANNSYVTEEEMAPWRKATYGYENSCLNYYKENLRKELIRVAKEYY